jgi:hypothetical protein
MVLHSTMISLNSPKIWLANMPNSREEISANVILKVLKIDKGGRCE